MSLSSARDLLKIVNEIFKNSQHSLIVIQDKLLLKVENESGTRFFMLDEEDLYKNLWDVLNDINFLMNSKNREKI
jgi:hypothetical protein